MAKTSRSFVRLFDANDRYLKFVPHDDAARFIRNGQWNEKKREHGRLIEVRLKPIYTAKPSNSQNSPTLITAGECKTNAFAQLKQKLGEKLTEFDEIVLEKVAGFTPGATDEYGKEVYLGPSWGDRVRLVHAPAAS